MSLLVADCPRCGAQHITFDVKQELYVGRMHEWQRIFEVFCVCRNCNRSTTFIVTQDNPSSDSLVAKDGALVKFDASINPFMTVKGFVSLRDQAANAPPDHVPDDIKAAFTEASTCLAVECWNAAGTMFRLCIDLATRPLLPPAETLGLNAKTRRDLGLRLVWLFDNGELPGDLRELSACIREDGNDGAHAGTLGKEDAADLLDFAHALLERLYTEPERLRLARQRRDERRKSRGQA